MKIIFGAGTQLKGNIFGNTTVTDRILNAQQLELHKKY
jgi:hypothetical protein